jgi:alpha-ketoglutarate-dependent taurine dioxygenase
MRRSWPASADSGILAEEIDATLRAHGDAFIVTDVGDDQLLRLCARIGTPFAAGSGFPSATLKNGFVCPVEARGDGEGVKDVDGHLLYSTTNRALPCHTDGFANEVAPDYLLLHCIRPASGSGKSCLVHVDDILLEVDDGVRALMWERSLPSLAGFKSVLFGSRERPSIRYNGLEIRRMVSRGVTLSAEATLLAVHLETTIARLASAAPFTLNVGDLLVVDNRRVLHGRTSFPASSGRLVHRVWLRRHVSSGDKCTRQ